MFVICKHLENILFFDKKMGGGSFKIRNCFLITFKKIYFWNKVFQLNLVRKLWRTDKSNTFLRVMPTVQLLPQTLPVTCVWPRDRTHDICAATRAFYH